MIIAITGQARAGKDYFADLIQKELDIDRKSIATNLKVMLAEALDISLAELEILKNTDPSYRRKLQNLGSRINVIAPTAQVDAMYQGRDQTKTLLVTDLRLKTELAYLESQDKVVLIKVVDFNQKSGDTHISEQDMQDTEPDYLLDNTDRALTKQHAINIIRCLKKHIALNTYTEGLIHEHI